MKIICEDNINETSRVVATGLTHDDAGKMAVELGNQIASRLPNNPRCGTYGPDAIGVFIGLYRIATFRIMEEE